MKVPILLFAVAATALTLAACSSRDLGAPTNAIEFRSVLIKSTPCGDCILLLLQNPVTPDPEILVRRQPDLRLAPDEVAEIQAIRIELKGRSIWKATVILDDDGRQSMLDFAASQARESSLLISVGGVPTDVVTSPELGVVLSFGRYRSLNELEEAFGVGSVRQSQAAVPESSSEAERVIREAEAAIRESRKSEEALDEIERAIERDDLDRASSLLDDLESEAGPNLNER